MDVLIDTSVWVSGASNEISSGWARAILRRFSRHCITPIVLGELIAGVEMAADPTQRHRRRCVLDEARSAEVLALGERTAEEFGLLFAALAQRGRKRSRTNDLWLAASAREHRLPILTCHPADFADLPGVRTIGPDTPPEAIA